MDDLTTFLNSVESTARKILKQQNKKQQQQAARDRVALAKASTQQQNAAETSSHTPTRDELRVAYASGGSLIITAPTSNQKPPRSPSRSEHSSSEVADDGLLPRLPPPRSPVASVPPGSIYSPLQLPAINRKGKPAQARTTARRRSSCSSRRCTSR